VQDQRIIAHAGVQQSLFDRFKPLEIQMLFALEFVCAMRVADRHRKRVHAGTAHKLDCFIRVRVMTLLGIVSSFLAFVELRADQLAQFPFHHAIVLVGVINHALANLDILLERLVAGINHHARKTFIYAILAQLE